ncbi:hypothetical protein GCM10028778_12330 [Barrientosiimonas marina]|uniref:S-layer homology domain-containing protein n=1 Tax=Lentibacillus kimchii TaxID=1542911 RepID=A0ABW2UWW5_9BACI
MALFRRTFEKVVVVLIGLLLAAGFMAVQASPAEAQGQPAYTITPDSKTYEGNMMNYSTYNDNTKHYYLLRSYLEQLEETDGGTLILSQGTYTISNTLYVPSNVTIKLQDGAKIVKGNQSGTSQFSASSSIFQFIRPSLAKQDGVYGGYNGEKNIKISGSGDATIDLNGVYGSLAIIAGHNQNVTIENIHFKHMHANHFIEMDATKNAVIRHNTFTDAKPSPKRNKEAINLDTPDQKTNGWSQDWSTYDKTANKNVTIENNVFRDLERAIGTHKYSGGSFHDRIIIRGNTIDTMQKDAIRVMNWRDSVIAGNLIKNVAPSSDHNNRGVLVSGAHNPHFRNNTFVSMPRAMQFMVWQNHGAGSEYDTTYNELSSQNIKDLKTNTIVNGDENFIRNNKKLGEFGKDYTDNIDIQTSRFIDMDQSQSGYDQVVSLMDQGIISGYDDNTFRPYQSISRQHVALMLANALNLSAPADTKAVVSQFEDIDSDHLYAGQIAAMAKADIFSGANGFFKPNENITRSQMATVLVGAMGLEATGEPVELTDIADIGASHRQSVRILAQNKITIGKTNANGDHYYDGTGKLTRTQFAILLKKAM